MSDRLFQDPEASPYEAPREPEFTCPVCGNRTDGRILDSRPRDGYRYRRRICESCGARFTTHEIITTDLKDAVERLARAAGFPASRIRPDPPEPED